MELTRLNGENFREMLRGGQRNLEEHRSEVDALNVFPVPDGDTGTNMMLTLRSAVKEVEALNSASLAVLAKAASTGSMMGARGNSGVIFSQLLRGIAQSLEGKGNASGSDFADAMQMGVKTAYKAVMKPIEGTILTVAREAARGAVEAARRDDGIDKVLEAAIKVGKEALIHTPELLPVLKKAGVVDAGGKGLVLIWEGMLEGLRLWQDGKPVAAYEQQPEPQMVEARVPEEIHYPTEELAYIYCTEAIVKGSGLPLVLIREKLAGLGDSLVVAGSEELARVHVHTNHPGRVLEICLEYGSVHQVKIDNMQEQHQHLLETAAVIDNHQDLAGITAVEDGEDASPVSTSVIAVAPGAGLAEILLSLGVEKVVEGGQSMNPSIEDLVMAIDQTMADEVLILPNNSNVILAAEQARGLTTKKAMVIPSRNFPQAVASMIAYNPNAPLQENYSLMQEGMERVRSGEVTFAVRDSKFDGVEIKAGQILGVEDDRIRVVGSSVPQVVEELMGHLVKNGDELISIYWGHEETEAAADDLAERLRTLYPRAEIEVHFGGQPLYYYIISVE